MTLQAKFDAAYQKAIEAQKRWVASATPENFAAWESAKQELKQAYDLLHKADATQSEKAEKK